MPYRIKARPSSIILSKYEPKLYCPNSEWRSIPTARKIPVGTLSDNARRKLRSAIKWLIACSPSQQSYEKKAKRMVSWQINFVTLTFKNNMQDDRKARQLLSMWLEVAKYRWAVERYVWKAEPQKRGAIHFHICTNKYIPWRELQFTWNRLLGKHGHPQPFANSIDVHATDSVNSLESYLCEYMLNDSKHEGRRGITGKLWGCDHALSNAGKQFSILSDEMRHNFMIEMIAFNLRNKFAPAAAPALLKFVDIFCLPAGFWTDLPECHLKNLYNRELSQLSPTIRAPELFQRTVTN